jgi:hypothetical protein
MPSTTQGTTVLSGLTSAIEQSTGRTRQRVRCASRTARRIAVVSPRA